MGRLGALLELELNKLEGRYDGKKTSAANATSEDRLLERADKLDAGETLILAKSTETNRLVALEVDWYQFRAQIDHLETSLIMVTKTFSGTAQLVCPLEIQQIGSWRWLRVKLNRVTCPEDLNISTSFRLSVDSASIIFPQITSSELCRELRCNSKLLELERHQLQPLQTLRIPPSMPSVFPRQSPLQGPATLTEELQLTKSQVTYLIGAAGTRIEATRLDSQATIKVLPIPRRLTASEQNHPHTQTQSLAITGNHYQVATALVLLECQLNLHRLAPRQHL